MKLAFHTMTNRDKNAGAMLRRVVASCVLLLLIHTGPAYGQNNCKVEINNASDNFEIGRANDVIRLLDACLDNKFVEKDDRVEMYRLLSLSYLAKRDSAVAFGYVEDLLKTNSRYKSRTITDDPQFKFWVDQLRPKWHERWIWRSAVVGGVAGAILGYRVLTAEDKPLPLPPTGPQ
ncbi:MAG: hypothetical protein AB8G77_19195 [Rhodothermales bacterium]